MKRHWDILVVSLGAVLAVIPWLLSRRIYWPSLVTFMLTAFLVVLSRRRPVAAWAIASAVYLLDGLIWSWRYIPGLSWSPVGPDLSALGLYSSSIEIGLFAALSIPAARVGYRYGLLGCICASVLGTAPLILRFAVAPQSQAGIGSVQLAAIQLLVLAGTMLGTRREKKLPVSLASMQETSTPGGLRLSFGEAISALPIAVVGVGVATFIPTYKMYASYFASYGLTPLDAGWTYMRLLDAQSGWFLSIASLGGAIVLAIIVLTLALLGQLRLRARGRFVVLTTDARIIAGAYAAIALCASFAYINNMSWWVSPPPFVPHVPRNAEFGQMVVPLVILHPPTGANDVRGLLLGSEGGSLILYDGTSVIRISDQLATVKYLPATASSDVHIDGDGIIRLDYPDFKSGGDSGAWMNGKKLAGVGEHRAKVTCRLNENSGTSIYMPLPSDWDMFLAFDTKDYHLVNVDYMKCLGVNPDALTASALEGLPEELRKELLDGAKGLR